MNKAKYIWSWKDDEGIYRNEASSIEEILEEIIEYYDERAKEIAVEQKDGSFVVRYVSGFDDSEFDWDEMIFGGIEEIDGQEESFEVRCEFEFEANIWDAAIFLNVLARVYGRQDQFLISENK